MKPPAQIGAEAFVAEMLKRNRLHDEVQFEECRGTKKNIIIAGCKTKPEFCYSLITDTITLDEYRAAVLAEIEKAKLA